MRLSVIRRGVVLVPACLVAASAVCAQPAPAPAAAQASQPPQLRSQMSIMEGILERAVGEGIRGAISQMPDLFQGPGMWVTPPRARGFKIDGYGLFFDVEVPGLTASFTWSISVINRNNEVALVNEFNQLRALLSGVPDETKRAELKKGLDRVQARVSGAALSEPGVPPQQAAAAALVSDRTSAGGAPVPLTTPRNPDEIYTGEVRKALTNVMLEHGITVPIGPDEWLTIAASQSRGGWEQADTMTLYLSIQGRNLVALRAGQITREEAAKRMVVKNY